VSFTEGKGVLVDVDEKRKKQSTTDGWNDRIDRGNIVIIYKKIL
jgi:hypothetical protein